MLSRKDRVKLIRDQVKKDWHDKWWMFIMEHEAGLNWKYISQNLNITPAFINANPAKP